MNISMMVTFSYRPEWNKKGNDTERPDAFIIRKLGFTEAQQNAYIKLRNRHHDSMITLNARGRNLRAMFFDGLKKPDVKQQTDSIASLIAANQKQIEEVTYYHFMQVRALCTDQQKVLFDNIIDEVLRRMSRPPRPDRAGGHGGDGPPPPPEAGFPPDGNGPPQR